ncbi:tetratricopeptide repeat protein [Chitinimonas naiadis]
MLKKWRHQLPWLAMLVSLGTSAAPWRPTDPNEVLEVLPTRLATGPDAAALRSQLGNQSLDVGAAVSLARQYLQLARASGDPHYLGYAEAAISRWTTQTRMPTQVRLMRAILAQRNHAFGPALADLALVLKAEPNNTEALLTRATIQQVRADYAAARKDCNALLGVDTLLLGAVCRAQLDSLNGNAPAALALLKKLDRGQGSRLTPALQEWLWLSQADIAQRLGDQAQAEMKFKALLQLPGTGPETRVVYADWLLSQNRASEVLPLLAEETRNDNALLRLALAEQALGAPQASGHIATLQARFVAARLRGDRVHLREEARFRLSLLRDRSGALALAQANWQVQREPADLRLLLESALRAGNREVARQASAWAKANRLQDVALQLLLVRQGEAA